MNRIGQLRDGVERAVLFDSWGQMVEAAKEYEAVAKDTHAWLQTHTSLPEVFIPLAAFSTLSAL